MKLRYFLFAFLAMSLLLFACSGKGSIEVSCEDFQEDHHRTEDIEVKVGDEFTMTLCSNPTTGFTWSEVAIISDQTVIEQIDHRFVSPETKGNKSSAPGTPGQDVWTFKALKEGTTTISMEYSRPWQGGEKGEWTFELTVKID